MAHASMKYYHNPNKGLYARAWKMRRGGREHADISIDRLKWKELHDLSKKTRDRIALLNLTDSNGPVVPGLGSHRDSKLHPPLRMYFFYDDTGESE